MRYNILIIVLVFAMLLPFYPARAVGLNFGGRIVYSNWTICWIGPVPVPVDIIVVERTGITTTLAYIGYAPLLRLLGISPVEYLWYKMWPAGSQSLGKYIPVPSRILRWTINPLTPSQDGSQCVAVFYRN